MLHGECYEFIPVTSPSSCLVDHSVQQFTGKEFSTPYPSTFNSGDFHKQCGEEEDIYIVFAGIHLTKLLYNLVFLGV